MSETTSSEPQGTETTSTTEPTTTATSEPQGTETEIDWKAKSREWERKAKENLAAAKKLSELEEAQKTEQQKLVERAEAAESKVAEFERRDQVKAWAEEIVKDSPVPASALRGSTREELEEHFAELSTLIAPKEQGEQKKGAVGPYVPTAGQAPAGAIGDVDFDAAIAKAESERNFALAITLKQQKAAAAAKTKKE